MRKKKDDIRNRSLYSLYAVRYYYPGSRAVGLEEDTHPYKDKLISSHTLDSVEMIGYIKAKLKNRYGLLLYGTCAQVYK